MRTTVTVDDALLAKAAELTGVKEKSTLLREGLQTLVRVESARRLALSAAPTRKLPRRRDAGRRPGDPGRHFGMD